MSNTNYPQQHNLKIISNGGAGNVFIQNYGGGGGGNHNDNSLLTNRMENVLIINPINQKKAHN